MRFHVRTVPAAAGAVALLLQASAAFGQSTLSTRVDTTVVTVGDRLTLEVTVEHPAEAVVSWPDSVDVEPFELLEVRVDPVASQQDAAVSAARFSFTVFQLGELELPSLSVRVLHPDGTEESLITDAYGVEVVSVGVDESGEIREIRGPLGLPLGTLRILSWVLALLLLAAAGYALWRRLRSGREEVPERPSGPPPRAPHEVALDALAELEGSDLLRQGRVKEFHIRISEILRRYVEARYRVPALEMTTWEVLEGLATVGADPWLLDDLRRFLDQCDLVKFAKAKPDEERSLAMLQLGRAMVERSSSASRPKGSDERPGRGQPVAGEAVG